MSSEGHKYGVDPTDTPQESHSVESPLKDGEVIYLLNRSKQFDEQICATDHEKIMKAAYAAVTTAITLPNGTELTTDSLYNEWCGAYIGIRDRCGDEEASAFAESRFEDARELRKVIDDYSS